MKRALLILMLSMGLLGAYAQEPKNAPKNAAKEPVAAGEKSAEKHESAEAAEKAEKAEATEKAEKAEKAEAAEKAEKQEKSDLIFKTVNFVLLAGLIIYYLRKPAGEFFAARTASIRQGMADAAIAREAADKRLADMEQRLTHLGDEIARLRSAAAGEDRIQAARMSEATDAEAAKIRTAAEAEIDTIARSARLELKKYAAKLAVDLAEERLKTEMNPQSQAHLLAAYVKDLGGRN